MSTKIFQIADPITAYGARTDEEGVLQAMKPTIDEVREILSIFLDSEMKNLHLEVGDVRLAVSKEGGAPVTFAGSGATVGSGSTAAPAAGPAAAAPSEASAAPASADLTQEQSGGVASASKEGLIDVTAPSLGVFYRRPAPDQPPFVEVGSEVRQDDPVCLIEVMKLFNRVTAPTAGRIVEILVDDATTVEYGQVLMRIEPMS